MFIRNCWYVAAWDTEIPAKGLFHRTLLNEPVLLYRDTQGRWLLDRLLKAENGGTAP